MKNYYQESTDGHLPKVGVSMIALEIDRPKSPGADFETLVFVASRKWYCSCKLFFFLTRSLLLRAGAIVANVPQ